MTDECSEQHTEIPLYQCIFRGQSDDEGEPIQRIYVTDSQKEADSFNAFLAIVCHETWALEHLDTAISNQFPGLHLLKEERGNDITAFEDLKLPDELPLGESIWDEDNNVQLLKRALIEHYDDGTTANAEETMNLSLISQLFTPLRPKPTMTCSLSAVLAASWLPALFSGGAIARRKSWLIHSESGWNLKTP